MHALPAVEMEKHLQHCPDRIRTEHYQQAQAQTLVQQVSTGGWEDSWQTADNPIPELSQKLNIESND